MLCKATVYFKSLAAKPVNFAEAEYENTKSVADIAKEYHSLVSMVGGVCGPIDKIIIVSNGDRHVIRY